MGLLKTVITAVEAHNTTHPEKKATRIEEIQCETGLLSSVEPQTLRGCFEIFSEGTVAFGATLTLRTAPLPCRCESCGHTFSLTQRRFACPACHAEQIHCDGGHGLMLTALTIAIEETDHA